MEVEAGKIFFDLMESKADILLFGIMIVMAIQIRNLKKIVTNGLSSKVASMELAVARIEEKIIALTDRVKS